MNPIMCRKISSQFGALSLRCLDSSVQRPQNASGACREPKVHSNSEMPVSPVSARPSAGLRTRVYRSKLGAIAAL